MQGLDPQPPPASPLTMPLLLTPLGLHTWLYDSVCECEHEYECETCRSMRTCVRPRVSVCVCHKCRVPVCEGVCEEKSTFSTMVSGQAQPGQGPTSS